MRQPPAPASPAPGAAPAPAPARRRPALIVTYALLGVTSLVFLAQLGSEQLLGGDLIIAYGAKVNAFIAAGEYWRLVTPLFVHGSLLHFFFNMYALYNLGRQVEGLVGSLRLAVIYFYAGLAGSIASLYFTTAPSVGASGAIFGLIGTLAVLFYRNREIFGQRGRAMLQQIVIIAAVNLLFGLQGGIDNWAHMGGLAGGLLLSWVIGPVWQVSWDPNQAGRPMLLDAQPLTASRWALALLLLAALLSLFFGWLVWLA